MQVFQNETFDAERALYGVHSAQVINCEFAQDRLTENRR